MDPGAYSFEGGTPDDTYIVEQTADNWAVYYAERGLRFGERIFASEDEAYRHLLDLLLRDRTTRRR